MSYSIANGGKSGYVAKITLSAGVWVVSVGFWPPAYPINGALLIANGSVIAHYNYSNNSPGSMCGVTARLSSSSTCYAELTNWSSNIISSSLSGFYMKAVRVK